MTDEPAPQLLLTRRNILANIATLFSGSVFAQGITTVIFILTARQLGPDQYGQYTGSMTLAVFCSFAFSLGLNLWLLRTGGRDPAQIGNLVGSVLALKIGIGVFWLLLMMLLATWIDSTSLPARLVRLSVLTIWLNNLFMTILTAFKAVLKNRINVILEVLSVTAMLLVTIGLIRMGTDQAATFLTARVWVQLISLFVAVLVIWRVLSVTATQNTAWQAIKEMPPYAASEFLAWMYMRVDVLIIAFLLNEYAVGLYAPAEGIINALYLVPVSIQFVMLPVLSNLFTTDILQAWKTAKRVILLLAGIGAVLSAAVFISSRYIVGILGTSYAGSDDILRILSIILLFHSVALGVSAILVATNQQSQRTKVQGIVSIANICLNLLVIQSWGIQGVAYVYVFTEFALLLGYARVVLRSKDKIEFHLLGTT